MASGLRATLFALVMSFTASHASADTLVFNGQFRFGGPEAVNILAPTPPAPLSAGAGEFIIFNQTANKTLFTYCVELAQLTVQTATYLPTSLTTAFTAPVATLIDKLFTSAYASVNNAVSSAAFQLALWEVIADPNSFNLSSGVFQVSASTAGVITQANAFLAGLATAKTGGFSYTVWRSEGAQDQISVSAIPEPSTYALLIAGLGMFAFIARRRFRA